MSCLAPHIEAFLREHMTRHRAASAHTCDSYAYSFQSLFEFADRRLRTMPSALTLEQLDAPLIAAFLEHLESARRNSAQTRNIRLAALRSFLKFAARRDIVNLSVIEQALGSALEPAVLGYFDARHGGVHRCGAVGAKAFDLARSKSRRSLQDSKTRMRLRSMKRSSTFSPDCRA